MNYKIYTCYHDDTLINKYNLINDDHHILYPTHKQLKEKNINYLHDCLSEICAMYYVWKNNKYCDFIGFEHYRRRFIKSIPNLNNDECYVLNYEYDMGCTIKTQYISTLNNYGFDIKNDFDLYCNILNKLYGKNNKYVEYLSNSYELIWDDCFIMSYNKFCLLCEFVFNIFDEFNKITKINYNLENYYKHYNCITYLIRPHIYERLIGIFILLNFEKNKIFYENIHYNTSSCFERNN